MGRYYSEHVSGNLHDATRYLNDYVAKQFPEHEVVAVSSDGYNSIVVYRVPGPSLNININTNTR